MSTLYDQETSPDPITRDDETPETIVDIHELTPPLPPPPALRGYFSPTRTMSSLGENFTTISREFNALVIAGSSMTNNNEPTAPHVTHHEEREEEEETNPLAIVPDQYPGSDQGSGNVSVQGREGMLSIQRVKREEVEAKIAAWQTAKLAKINNRFKREDAVINGFVNEQVHKANSYMKKIERKLEERKARAMEKTHNKVAKAQRKVKERRAAAEAKRGIEVAKVVEVANLMRAVGRPPAKRSFFSFS